MQIAPVLLQDCEEEHVRLQAGGPQEGTGAGTGVLWGSGNSSEKSGLASGNSGLPRKVGLGLGETEPARNGSDVFCLIQYLLHHHCHSWGRN